ncbi:MAG: tRNA lysidine(34) synthetase TilS [Acidiferrobacterales bacterium]|nr:tRNA lysidine(34) synthetase TilS [Acidiferrobacterales bacterium]
MSSKKKANHFSAALLAEQLSNVLPSGRACHLKLAYSGGIDSLALLLALVELRPHATWQLSAIHVNHGLSADADRWVEECRQTCNRLDVPLVVESVAVEVRGQGLEAAARDARYTALSQHIGPDDVLLTAHQRDDQLETVFLHLLRGTGAHGLAGMSASRKFSDGLHLRPMLGFSREAIERYVRAGGLDWVNDDSNDNARFSRNFLRHEILPRLRSRWPAAEEVITRSAGHAAAASELLDEIAHEDLQRCAGKTPNGLSLGHCQNLSRSRLQNLLRHWIAGSSLPQASARHIDEIVRQISRPSRSGQALVAWPGGACYRYRDELTLTGRTEVPDDDFEISWHPEDVVSIAALGIALRMTPTTGQGLAAARIEDAEIVLRNRRGGESLQLPGRGHRHQLKKLFQEAGVSPLERSRLPLVYVNNELAAVGNRWIADSFAARKKEPGFVLEIHDF